MIPFFDENIPPQIVRALRELGYEARHLQDELPRGTEDRAMLEFLSTKEDWFLVSQDSRIARHPHERATVLQAGIGAFFYTGRSERSVAQMMVLILETLPKIIEHAEHARRPFLVGISDQRKMKAIE